jgi:hypothetical protein
VAPERTRTQMRVVDRDGIRRMDTSEPGAKFDVRWADEACPLAAPHRVQSRTVTYSDWVDVPAENGDDDER